MVSSLVLAGCAGEDLFSTTDQAVMISPGDDEGGGCPVWGCGSNSPEIDSLGFHELYELGGGVVNDEGYAIEGFRKRNSNGDWAYYTPDVLNAELVARSGRGLIVLSGSQLLGAEFLISRNVRGALLHYEMRVTDIGRLEYWAQPTPTPVFTYTYQLEWRVAGYGHYEKVCKNPGVPEDRMDGFHAVLFDDDRINADEIRVTGTTPYWFNIGCGGHALAKQHLTGHTKAAGVRLGITTTINQRTANLKMFAADYCGNGDPFTVAGQPLQWRDESNWYNDVLGAVEARWNENGAMCLTTPRIDAGTIPLGTETFPDGVEPLLDPNHLPIQWCAVRPPPCDPSRTAMLGAHILSANP